MTSLGTAVHRISQIIFITWLLSACAGTPEYLSTDPAKYYESRIIEPGVEILTGRCETGAFQWMAVRSDTVVLSISPPLLSDSTPDAGVLSRHAIEHFTDLDVRAVLTASPHNPIRYRAGLPQDVGGFYQLDRVTYSKPDNRHDALGINEYNRPELLNPREQENWKGDSAGGFYVILFDGIPMNPVTVKDAVSAAGWSEDGSLVILLVIKGSPGRGCSYEKAGKLLLSLGAWEGIAMDGGGSARLVWKEDENLHSFPLVPLYRAVPNHLVLKK
ncbi:MAG: phosphodiester glycosidase family protein [Spirochaetaceae bacterium]|nr:phosphodiester glycosidase family protein [Spirochaetaceae bacterium]